MSFWTVAESIANIASASAQVYEAYSSAEAAKKSAKLQKQEVDRQRRLAEAEARRTARVRTAQVRAQQGRAGATTSMGASGVIGIGTTLQTGLEDLYERSAFNKESIEMQKDAAVSQSIMGGMSALATFEAKDFQTFTDMLNVKPVDSLSKTQSQYPYIARR